MAEPETQIPNRYNIEGTDFFIQYDRRVSALGRGTEYGFRLYTTNEEGEEINLSNLQFDDPSRADYIAAIQNAVSGDMDGIQAWMGEFQAEHLQIRDRDAGDTVISRDINRMRDAYEGAIEDFDGRIGEWIEALSVPSFLEAIQDLDHTGGSRADNSGKIRSQDKADAIADVTADLAHADAIIAEVQGMFTAPEPDDAPGVTYTPEETIDLLDPADLLPPPPQDPSVAEPAAPEMDDTQVASLTAQFMQVAQMFVDGDASNDYQAVQAYETILVEMGMELSDEELARLDQAAQEGMFMYSADTVRLLSEIESAQQQAIASGASPIESLKGVARATFGVVSDPASYVMDTPGTDDTKDYYAGLDRTEGDRLEQTLFTPSV